LTSRTITTPQGISLEVQTAGEGGKGFALLLHGFPEHAISWRHQMKPLEDAGYEVWVPNLRGYGGSSIPRGKAAYEMPHLLKDVAALIDQGAKGRPVTLIAHDWGALIAWCFAADKVRPLERLVIMNVPHPAVFIEGMATPAQRKKSWYVMFFQLPFLPELGLRANGAKAVENAFTSMAVNKTHFTPEVLATYRKNALRPGGMTAMVNYYRANFGKAFDPYRRETVAPIATPTLMIWGEEDTALGVELTEGYAGLVSDLTLHRLPGVSHWVQQEAPEQVNPILLGWLAAPRP
jgi:epoxide hydrolase 4